jgi:hypothetical protein
MPLTIFPTLLLDIAPAIPPFCAKLTSSESPETLSREARKQSGISQRFGAWEVKAVTPTR